MYLHGSDRSARPLQLDFYENGMEMLSRRIILLTLADEVGKARQGEGDGEVDRVAKQARPVTAKTRRGTRYHIERGFLVSERSLVREFSVDSPSFIDRRIFP